VTALTCGLANGCAACSSVSGLPAVILTGTVTVSAVTAAAAVTPFFPPLRPADVTGLLLLLLPPLLLLALLLALVLVLVPAAAVPMLV
jgi:hypothetical protein